MPKSTCPDPCPGANIQSVQAGASLQFVFRTTNWSPFVTGGVDCVALSYAKLNRFRKSPELCFHCTCRRVWCVRIVRPGVGGGFLSTSLRLFSRRTYAIRLKGSVVVGVNVSLPKKKPRLKSKI